MPSNIRFLAMLEITFHTVANTSNGRALIRGGRTDVVKSPVPRLAPHEGFVASAGSYEHTAAIASRGRGIRWGCDAAGQTKRIPPLQPDELWSPASPVL